MYNAVWVILRAMTFVPAQRRVIKVELQCTYPSPPLTSARPLSWDPNCKADSLGRLLLAWIGYQKRNSPLPQRRSTSAAPPECIAPDKRASFDRALATPFAPFQRVELVKADPAAFNASRTVRLQPVRLDFVEGDGRQRRRRVMHHHPPFSRASGCCCAQLWVNWFVSDCCTAPQPLVLLATLCDSNLK